MGQLAESLRSRGVDASLYPMPSGDRLQGLALWIELTKCRCRADVIGVAGEPRWIDQEHPKEDWAEVWSYDWSASGSTTHNALQIRFDGEALHAIDVYWASPGGTCRMDRRSVRRGHSAARVLATLGIPVHFYPRGRLVEPHECWSYRLTDSPAPEFFQIGFEEGRVDSLTKNRRRARRRGPTTPSSP